MKRARFLAGCLGAALALAGTHAAERPAEAQPKAPSVGTSRGPEISIAVRLVEAPEAVFAKNEDELRAALRAGDEKRLLAFEKEGLAISSLPKVTTRSGQKAVINVIREFRYATKYLDEAGKLTPTTFETANLGVEFPVTATAAEDGVITFAGKLVVRVFEGFTKSDRGAFAPAFEATEASFLRFLRDGQTAGCWLPAARLLPKGDGGFWRFVEPPFGSSSTPRGTELTKLAFLVTAGIVHRGEAFPAFGALEVKAYDVASTALGRSERAGTDGAGFFLANSFGKDEAVPAGAVELAVKRKSAEHFGFRTASGREVGVNRKPQSAEVEIVSRREIDQDGQVNFSSTSLVVADGMKALMFSKAAGKSEAILIVFQRGAEAPSKGTVTPLPKSEAGNPPYGVPVEGKPGFVTSPHAPRAGYVDVRGYKPGAEVKDPYTGKMFKVP